VNRQNRYAYFIETKLFHSTMSMVQDAKKELFSIDENFNGIQD
jgi:hypothetical protein